MESKDILLVEDEIDTRTFLATLLTTHGYRIRAARDRRQAMRQLRLRRPQLVILNAMMPREEGLEVYRALKRNRELRRIPVVMLSEINPKVFVAAQNMAAPGDSRELPEPDAFVEKPVEPEELLQLAQTLISGNTRSMD